MPKKGSGGKSARAARALKKKEPQLIEPERKLLALRGHSSSQLSLEAMKDLMLLKKPDAKLLSRKNDILPFEDVTSLEFLCEKNDCSAFLYTSHNKKRPHNLVIGRTFDGHVTDMIEMGVDPLSAKSLEDIVGPKKLLGAKPLFLFQGEDWERHPSLTKLRSLMLDAFASKPVTLPKLALPGIDHVIAVTAAPSDGAGASSSSTGGWSGKVLWRVYTVVLKRSGGLVPRVALLPHGPNLDLTLRRTQFAAPDVERESLKVPAQLKPKKVKNVSHDEFGETLGRLHMQRQDFAGLQLRKSKGLKADRKAKKARKGEEQGQGQGEETVDMDEDGEEAGQAGAAVGQKRKR